MTVNENDQRIRRLVGTPITGCAQRLPRFPQLPKDLTREDYRRAFSGVQCAIPPDDDAPDPPISHWDGRFLGMAEHVATWSKHPVEQVGAVIADANHIMISQGFNGLPSGLDDGLIQELHTIHAEHNAILFALMGGVRLENCTLYCTHPPCSRCCAVIAQVRFISCVCCWAGSEAFNARWGADCLEGQKMLESKGITYIQGLKS